MYRVLCIYNTQEPTAVLARGRERNAAERSSGQSTGRVMKILGQLFETYNKHNRRPLRQEIIDLYDDEQNPAGTLVKIFVPLDFNEGIF